MWCFGRGSESDVWMFCWGVKRRGLKVNADKSKVRVLGERKENMCQSFKYLGCALDESRPDSAE